MGGRNPWCGRIATVHRIYRVDVNRRGAGSRSRCDQFEHGPPVQAADRPAGRRRDRPQGAGDGVWNGHRLLGHRARAGRDVDEVHDRPRTAHGNRHVRQEPHPQHLQGRGPRQGPAGGTETAPRQYSRPAQGMAVRGRESRFARRRLRLMGNRGGCRPEHGGEGRRVPAPELWHHAPHDGRILQHWCRQDRIEPETHRPGTVRRHAPPGAACRLPASANGTPREAPQGRGH